MITTSVFILCLDSVFLFFLINFFIIINCFNVLKLKIHFKNKKYYFNVFTSKK